MPWRCDIMEYSSINGNYQWDFFFSSWAQFENKHISADWLISLDVTGENVSLAYQDVSHLLRNLQRSYNVSCNSWANRSLFSEISAASLLLLFFTPNHYLVIFTVWCHLQNPTITITNGAAWSRPMPGGTPILGHIRDVRPEWVSFPCRKPVDGCKCLTKNLRMGHNFDIILPGNRWFSSKLNKTYCSLAKFLL